MEYLSTLLSNYLLGISSSFTDIGAGVVKFLPAFIGALVIVLIGWGIGVFLDKIVIQIVRAFKVDNALKGARVEDFLRRAGFNLNSGVFLGALVKWFVVVVFLVTALDILGLTQVTIFLQQVVLIYLPQVIVAVLILLVAAVIAEAMQKVVVGAALAAGIRSASLAGTITRWSIWIFAILMALFQLGIATTFIQTLFTGIVVALSLALGLSFGLGGQEAAARFIEKIRSEITHKG